MKRKPPLSLDEHRQLGDLLAVIHIELSHPDRLNRYLKKSKTMQSLLRATRGIEKLKSKLDSLLFKQQPDAANPSFYYGHQLKYEGRSIEDIRAGLDVANNIMNDAKVPAAIRDQYLRCTYSLVSVRCAIIDYPEDARRS